MSLTNIASTANTRPGAGLRWQPGLREDVSVRAFWIGCAAITLLAAMLRLWNLDGTALWGDEAITIVQSRLDLSTILFGNIDYHPPLSLVIQKLWSALFPSPAMARWPAALAGIATVFVMTLAVRDLFSRRAALFAGLLIAVSTGHVYFSQEARMYTLLVLALLLASWGAAGFSGIGQLRRWQYAALYIAGGTCMIGMHAIGLVLMAIVGLIGLAALIDPRERWARLKLLIGANFAVLVLSGAWIVQILTASDDHPGLTKMPVNTLSWFIFNMTGFPALREFSKPFDIALCLFAVGAVCLAWRDRLRTQAVMLACLILLFPLVLGGMQLFRPVLENRVVLPSVIGMTMGFGVAAAYIPQRGVRLAIVALIASAGLASTLIEMSDRKKPDDYRRAYAFIDAHGFAGAPIIVCRNYSGAALWLERENEIHYFKPDGVLEQSRPGYWQVAAIHVAPLEMMPAREIDRRLGGGYLLEEGLETMLGRPDRIALVRPWCLRDDEARIRDALSEAGFTEVASASIGREPGVERIIAASRTQVTLFRKQPATAD